MRPESPPKPCNELLMDDVSDLGCLGEDEEGLLKAEPEIDFETDPFVLTSSVGPDQEWEKTIRAIKPRKAEFPSADEQRAKIRQLLDVLVSEPAEPSAQQVEEAQEWLTNIDSLIHSHERLVASGFSACYPAWHELLKGSHRKSAKMVLGWIKNGFRPKFVGTPDAKAAKQKIVISMLSKVVPGKEIPKLPIGRFLHQIAFQNHQSPFRKWEFSSEQIVKLLEADAARIWDKSEPAVVIHPMGVVDSAGRDMMIANDRYLNLFLEAFPFRYEHLRDILAFTKKGSFMATWDLKLEYFHIPIHKDYQKYFCFKVGGIVFYFKVLCFGFAHACYVFIKVMQEPAIELRARGNSDLRLHRRLLYSSSN
jgi:hypothetical protein